MSEVISIHEYPLRPGVDTHAFETAFEQAACDGLFDLPGLSDYYLLKGLRGARQEAYAAVWIYASRSAWEALWGPAQRPMSRAHYPTNWRIWEDQVLSPFLDCHPDQIRYTAYDVIHSHPG